MRDNRRLIHFVKLRRESAMWALNFFASSVSGKFNFAGTGVAQACEVFGFIHKCPLCSQKPFSTWADSVQAKA